MTHPTTPYDLLNLLHFPSHQLTPSLYLWCIQNSKLGLTTLTEIAIKKCYIDPEFVCGICNLKTVTQGEAIKGKLVCVVPDLNQETLMTYFMSLPSHGSQIPSPSMASLLAYLLPSYLTTGCPTNHQVEDLTGG